VGSSEIVEALPLVELGLQIGVSLIAEQLIELLLDARGYFGKAPVSAIHADEIPDKGN